MVHPSTRSAANVLQKRAVYTSVDRGRALAPPMRAYCFPRPQRAHARTLFMANAHIAAEAPPPPP